MKRLLILALVCLIFILNVGSVTLSPEGIESISNVDFSTLDYTVDTTIQGIYEFSVTVEHSGSDPATTASVPIAWENVYYRLPLTNGVGILDESIVDYDLNGDGDKIDKFDVTWDNDPVRQWDVNITDGTTDIHAYAIMETSGTFPIIRNYTFNGESKLFTLGSETHFLYNADNDAATFGLGGAYIYNHPGPNFELALYSSEVNAIDFKINGDPVEVDFSATVKHIDDTLVNVPNNAPVYVVPPDAFAISPVEQVTFSCTIIAHEVTTFDLGLLINWSPDGVHRYIWVPAWEIRTLEAINRPHFIPVDTTMTQVESGVKQLTTIVKNIGAPATTGQVPVFWETDYYPLELNGGNGVLDESDIGLDLDGDGSTANTFTVTWLDNPIRPCDANVDGKDVYAILDQPQSPWYNLTYNISGQSKQFQLGSKTHCLYYADANIAEFGLCGTLRSHPSPSIKLTCFSNVSAEGFNINGNPMDEDHSEPFVLWYPDQNVNYTSYFIPDQALVIGTEEEIKFSCNLVVPKTTTTEVVITINWSPDGNIRYWWRTVVQETTIETWTTTPTSTTTTTTAHGNTGFSILITVLLVVPLLVHKRRKKKG
ncbi:MAG: hypothetical protein ACFE9L_10325 [Candidatus Hodarchaeota archaeon]